MRWFARTGRETLCCIDIQHGVTLVDVAFGILGPTALRIDGRLRENWGTPRLQAVLAALLVHTGRPVPISTLVEWAWPNEKPGPVNPASTFHTYATRIRRRLQQLPYPSNLYASNGRYRLEVDRALIDHHQFRELITRARTHIRTGDHERVVELAERALGLWRGRPLDDLSSEPAQAWRTALVRDEWLPANVLLLESLLAVGAFDQVLARLNDLQAGHPNDVGLAKLRMSALHGMDRSSEATTYYFRIRHRLLDDGDDQGANHVRQHHEALRTAPVAKQAKDVTPRQLPRDVTEFVGRTALLAELDDATKSSDDTGGLVILDGMAGVGKTALAVHWGHRARHRFPDGELFATLNGFASGCAVSQSTVVDDFLTALGHPPDERLSTRAKEVLLSRLLRGRRFLVILDNVRNSAHIQGLVDLLSDSVIIVTSRQRLTTLSAATGARRVHVTPMPDSEATDLLTARLGRHEVDHDVRARLVRPCGGLPLAVTLLAEHIASAGPARLSAFACQLDARQLITGIGEDGDGSTVAHTFFSWSYEALDPQERRLFRLLGLHPGPDIGMGLACACDGRTPEETRRGLGILVGAHLLERPVFDRHQFHDLLREFAIHRAELDDPPEARAAAERRIAGYYLATATRAHQALYPGKPIPPGLPGEVDAEPFSSAGHARRWLEAERSGAIAVCHRAAARGDHAHAWRIADTLAMYLDRVGGFEDSRVVRELAVTSAAAAGDEEATASARAGLGMVLTNLGEHAYARRCLDASLRFAEQSDNDRGMASVLYHLGRLEMSRGDATAAAEFFRRSLTAGQRTGDHEALGWTHCSLGEALHALADHDAALTHLHQGLVHAQHAGDRSAHAANLSHIAAIYRDRGDHRAAIAYCQQALTDLEETPNAAIRFDVETRLAEIDLERGEVAAARERAQDMLAAAHRSHDAQAEVHILEVLGNAYGANGETGKATEIWHRAADLHHHIGNTARAAVLQAHIKSVSANGNAAPSPPWEAG
jgi:tetratricopeptide (TPR) repeat protein/DNA-binding SARP family transcriptional activator